MAVIKDNRILLGSNRRFKNGFYSVLAGFVEPGESLEECVAREVCEEVGIAVENIRYFGSQPWPFPDCIRILGPSDRIRTAEGSWARPADRQIHA